MEQFDLFKASSAIPSIQLLITASQKAAGGELSINDFAAGIEDYSELFYQVINDLKDLLSDPGKINPELLQELDVQMNIFAEGLETLKLFVNLNELEYLIEGVKKLLACSREFYKLYPLLEKAITQVPPETACFYCGHKNPVCSKNCEKCHAILPRPLAEESAESSFDIKEEALKLQLQATSNFELLKLAGEEALAGRISLQEYERVVDSMARLVRACQEQYLARSAADKKTPETRLLKEAAEIYSQSVAELKKYPEDQNPESIENGLTLAETADKKLERLLLMGKDEKEQEEPPPKTAFELFEKSENREKFP